VNVAALDAGGAPLSGRPIAWLTSNGTNAGDPGGGVPLAAIAAHLPRLQTFYQTGRYGRL
jgi:hypothetical protein